MTSGIQIGEFFQGDSALPISLGDFDDPLTSLLDGRREQLMEWLDGRTEILGNVGGASITGPVYIGPGSVIESGAAIDGPVFIGSGCHVHHGAQIRNGTILGDHCVVGHSAEIKASVCMTGSKMQSGVFVGDSVIGVSARLGSGTILSNRRFDQKAITLGSGEFKLPTEHQFVGTILGDYSRLGANVVAAPGTVVGPHTWVASLASIWGYIPRGKLVLLKQELEYRDKEDLELRSGIGEYDQ